MAIRTLSRGAFNKAASRAKKAADSGLVFIAAGSKPAHVLLIMEGDQRPLGHPPKMRERLALPAAARTEFTAAKISINRRPADLT